MRSVVHYCQKCLGANPLGREHCARCGTRLMLVVEPPTARFDTGNFDAAQESHLLERVSALENRLARMTDKLEQTLDLMLRQTRSSYLDHTLLETLIAVLHEAGAVEAKKVFALWRAQSELETLERNESNHREQLREKILTAHRGENSVAFGQLLDEGLALLNGENAKRGLRLLERAAALAPGNAPLLSLLGQNFFAAGKMALARDYLERAFAASQEPGGLRLLLGLACADEGETERARELLGEAATRDRSSFAAHYGLGWLLAVEQKWPAALAQFKQALAATPAAETHYVVGCTYYQLGRDRMAARHLRKALALDEAYAAAFYLLGMIHLRGGDQTQAREAFEAARIVEPKVARYRAACRLLHSSEAPACAPLFMTVRQSGKRLLTSSDQRLARVLCEEALKAMSAREP